MYEVLNVLKNQVCSNSQFNEAFLLRAVLLEEVLHFLPNLQYFIVYCD